MDNYEKKPLTPYSPYPKMKNLLSAYNLSIGYSKKKNNYTVQSDLNLELKAGELVCLIGPNGSGKSTLMRTLSGLQKALKGDVLIDEKNITTLSQNEKALLISMVLTDRVDIDNATVYDIVSLGRYPHTSWWNGISKNNDEAISNAIRMVHLEHKTLSPLSELSDGERQRVMIAKALAQDTPIILLDEPTAHLDLPNRVEIMLLLHKLAHQTQKGILLSTHELDLALQAGDRIWLMDLQKGVKSGIPEDLVLNGSFNETFESKNYFFNPSNGNFSMNYDLEKSVSVSGDKTRMYWTLRALARAGYKVIPEAAIRIVITENEWVVQDKKVSNIENLLNVMNTL
ncbi:ABC transporter ATP-binding protein [Paludibacter sp. 221]|uniref:ABC transporter ATP-binding protein n=1 Tax=Paludibacter sp. 221 TaxID=2302939 RepID=UPI0013CFAEBC|nr:ABC transporter ATP-binding protein [Paludibacter sp. 221]NDV46438.1 ABC transporter ATP-binding protein [Paludibacter sp. 221]